ncbi:hypothetical protein BYT27DRAFT_7166905 [Phlegmacium glaucopus]|nr:hypothetical protein BYT27DRAFT_7166905 [Phlegmacium glaucopus]
MLTSNLYLKKSSNHRTYLDLQRYMHQALQKIDILHEIFGHLTWQDPGDTDHELQHRQRPMVPSTLLSCALTCQAFREPALDKLWWRLDNIVFLFKLLPSLQQFIQRQYYLDGPIADADWKVFDRYARRVYVLHDNPGEVIDASVFIQISQGRKDRPFLPSLRYLYTTRADSNILAFLLPSLRWFYCHPPPMDHGFYPSNWALISGLAQVAPGLQSLILHLPLSKSCLDSLIDFKSLRHLSLCHGRTGSLVDADFFAKISSLENLASLRLAGLANFTLSRYSSVSPYFPTLEALTVSSKLGQMIPLLRIAKFQQLKSLSYTEEVDYTTAIAPVPPYPADMQNWQIFFQLLCQNANEFLESLTIGRAVAIGPGPQHVHTVGVHGVSAFPDLFQLKLRKFIISSHLFVSLSNLDVQYFADAWPTLQVLHLTTCYIGTDFHALIEVAKHLPLLDELHLPINAQSLPSFDTIPLLSHPLRSLNVMSSLVKDASTFARCVDRLFPNLKTFQGGGSCLMLWDQVKVLIPYFQGARQDARLRLCQDVKSRISARK